VHVWQRFTGLHRGGKAGIDYDYTTDQLTSLELGREGHASAVEDWFVVTWKIRTGKLNPTDPLDINTYGKINNLIYKQQMTQAVYGGILSTYQMKQTMDQDYASVIVELRVMGMAYMNLRMLVSRGIIRVP